MEASIIRSDFYQELHQLEDLIMDFIEENGPHSLSNPDIEEIIRRKLIPKWADDIEVTSDEDMLYVRLILGDDYDSDININFNFYGRIRDRYNPLLICNIQNIRNDLEEHLGSFISQIQEEGRLTPHLKSLLDETIEKVLQWIKYDSYDTEVEINPNTGGHLVTGGYLVINIYSGSTYISFHFDL